MGYTGCIRLAVRIWLVIAASGVVRADDTNSSSGRDYSSFRIISERNIFDPNRSGRSTRTYTRRAPERRVTTESFALLGTMSYEKGSFAFFDGSRSQYRTVLEPSNNIAGYTILEIAATHVKLEGTNGTIELAVGMQMRRQDEGEWSLSARTESSGESSRSSSSNDLASAGSGGSADEVLKRLMQKREQEGNGEPPEAFEATPVQDEKADKAQVPERTDTNSIGESDDVLKRLMQKREQEINK